MFTFVGRTTARRVLISANASSPFQLSQMGFRVVRRQRVAPIAKSFSVSAWVRQPAAAKSSGTGSTATKKKTKAAASTTKKTTKKPKAKAAPKKKKATKKVLTPEQKEKAEVRDLRKKALLKGPALLPDSAWSVYVTENSSVGQGPLGETVRKLAADFKAISDIEKGRLGEIGQVNKERNKDTRREWVESHPPEAIYVANLARKTLARKTNKKRVYLIHDERQPKRANNGYTLFLKERFAESNQGSAKEIFRALSQEWKSISEADKASYKQSAAAESAKSQEERQSLRELGKSYVKTTFAKSP